MVILLLKRIGISVDRRGISSTHPVYTFNQQSASLHRLIPIVYVGVKQSCLLWDAQNVWYRNHRRFLKLILLFRRLCRCFQLLRTVIKTPQTPLLSPNRALKLSTKWKTTYLLGYWLNISFGDGLHLWLLGALVYLNFFGIDTVENVWGVNWLPRDFTRNIQSLGLSLICVVFDINKIGTRALKLACQ